MGWIECHGGVHSKQSNFLISGFLLFLFFVLLCFLFFLHSFSVSLVLVFPTQFFCFSSFCFSYFSAFRFSASLLFAFPTVLPVFFLLLFFPFFAFPASPACLFFCFCVAVPFFFFSHVFLLLYFFFFLCFCARSLSLLSLCLSFFLFYCLPFVLRWDLLFTVSSSASCARLCHASCDNATMVDDKAHRPVREETPSTWTGWSNAEASPGWGCWACCYSLRSPVWDFNFLLPSCWTWSCLLGPPLQGVNFSFPCPFLIFLLWQFYEVYAYLWWFYAHLVEGSLKVKIPCYEFLGCGGRNESLKVWMSESLNVWKFECLKVWMSESLNV